MKSIVDRFLAIEDQDLKSYIFSRKGGIYGVQITYKVNTDEKIGYYHKTEGIARNASGAFYKKSILEEWIVYNKSTKKVKVSNKLSRLRMHFLRDYFRDDVRDIVYPFIGKISPTLCKKIIEGKIQTFSDLISYHRSYTIRRKDVPLETVLRFMVYDKQQWLHIIEDPEKVETVKQLKEMTSDSNISLSMPFKFSVEETDKNKLEEMYEKWVKEQDIKYDTFKRLRNEDVSSTDVQGIVWKTSSADD